MRHEHENELYELVSKSQTGDTEAMKQIIQKLSPLIKRAKKMTSVQEQDDLEQYLIERIITIVKSYDLTQFPDFYDFYNQSVQESSFQSYLVTNLDLEKLLREKKEL